MILNDLGLKFFQYDCHFKIYKSTRADLNFEEKI